MVDGVQKGQETEQVSSGGTPVSLGHGVEHVNRTGCCCTASRDIGQIRSLDADWRSGPLVSTVEAATCSAVIRLATGYELAPLSRAHSMQSAVAG